MGEQVVAEQAVAGGHEQASAELLHGEHRGAIHQAVLSERGHPALVLDVEAAGAHRGGEIDALAVGRERHVGDIVVGEAVQMAVVDGTSLHRRQRCG